MATSSARMGTFSDTGSNQYREQVMAGVRRMIRYHCSIGWDVHRIRQWLDTQSLSETELHVAELILRHNVRSY